MRPHTGHAPIVFRFLPAPQVPAARAKVDNQVRRAREAGDILSIP